MLLCPAMKSESTTSVSLGWAASASAPCRSGGVFTHPTKAEETGEGVVDNKTDMDWPDPDCVKVKRNASYRAIQVVRAAIFGEQPNDSIGCGGVLHDGKRCCEMTDAAIAECIKSESGKKHQEFSIRDFTCGDWVRTVLKNCCVDDEGVSTSACSVETRVVRHVAKNAYFCFSLWWSPILPGFGGGCLGK